MLLNRDVCSSTRRAETFLYECNSMFRRLTECRKPSKYIGTGFNGLLALSQSTDPYSRMNLGIDSRLQSFNQILQGLLVQQNSVAANLQQAQQQYDRTSPVPMAYRLSA